MKCLKCGIENIENASWCANCGMELKKFQPEINNGIFNDVSEETHKMEGQNLQRSEQVIDQVQAPNIINESQSTIQFDRQIDNSVKPKNKVNSKILVIVLVVLAILIGFVLFVLGNKNDSKNLENGFDEEQLILVKKNDKYGYIDTNGKFVIEARYDGASPFYGDYALVQIKTESIEDDEITYSIIDKKGNVKYSADHYYGIEHNDEYNYWIIENQLYDGSLKKLSGDNVEVDFSYTSDKYLSWKNEQNSTGGIMTPTGKITYTRKLEDNNDTVIVKFYENDNYLKDNYCIVKIGDKQGIVNCDTGKEVYDYIEESITSSYNNIFWYYSSENNDEKTIFYIQGDKVLYENTGNNVYLTYSSGDIGGYISISDLDKDSYDEERILYMDLSTQQITKQMPDIYSDDYSYNSESIKEWEEYSGYDIASCSGGYEIKKDDKVLVACDSYNFELFGEALFKYLSSKGKDYIIIHRSGTAQLVNLKNGNIDAEFVTDTISGSKKSPFVYYYNESNKIVIYNMLTNKSLEIDAHDEIELYMNYIIVEKNNKRIYYNNDLKQIYTEE